MVRVIFEGLGAGGGVGQRRFREQEFEKVGRRWFEIWLGAEEGVSVVLERTSWSKLRWRNWELGCCLVLMVGG